MTTKQKKQMLALAKFVDAEYENYWSADGGMVSCRFQSTFLSSYNYFRYELCRSNTHCTGN